MNKSFELDQNNAVIKGGKLYDLHNQYNFTGMFLNGEKRQLHLFFTPHPEYGQGQVPVSLVFDNLDYIEISPNIGTRDEFFLNEIGYKNPSDRDGNWLMDEKDATSDDHLFFRIGDCDYIRVHCQNADIIENIR